MPRARRRLETLQKNGGKKTQRTRQFNLSFCLSKHTSACHTAMRKTHFFCADTPSTKLARQRAPVIYPRGQKSRWPVADATQPETIAYVTKSTWLLSLPVKEGRQASSRRWPFMRVLPLLSRCLQPIILRRWWRRSCSFPCMHRPFPSVFHRCVFCRMAVLMKEVIFSRREREREKKCLRRTRRRSTVCILDGAK